MSYDIVSVIIPVYNASKTLKYCLESILSQTYEHIEVICVDDESIDESVSICEEFLKDDGRVKLYQKRNGGVASARNEGLKYVTGKYVTFVDQDDWIEPDMYEKMMHQALTEDADMVVCGYSKDVGFEKIETRNEKKIENPILDKNRMICYAFEREKYRAYAAFVWNKIFKTKIIKENNIMFDSTLKRGDDVYFYSIFASKAKKIFFIDKSFYHYIQRSDSITHIRDKNNLYRLEDILRGYDKAIKYLEKEKFEESAIFFLKCFYVYHASLLYEIAKQENEKEKQEKYRKAIELYYAEYVAMNRADEVRIERIEKMLKY